MPDLQPVFDELHARLAVHEDAFLSSHNLSDADTPTSRKVDDPSPDSLDSLSPELRRRMQGKSCFGFTRVDEGLFDELADLTMRGREQYDAAGLLRG